MADARSEIERLTDFSELLDRRDQVQAQASAASVSTSDALKFKRQAAITDGDIARQFDDVRALGASVNIVLPDDPFDPTVKALVDQVRRDYETRAAAPLHQGGGTTRDTPVTTPTEVGDSKLANKHRRWLAYGTLAASAGFAGAAIYWTYGAMDELRFELFLVREMTLGLGLILIGKALMTIVLLSAAYSSIRATERLLLPIHEWHRFVQLTSRRPKVDLNKRALDILAQAVGIAKDEKESEK